MYVIPKKKLAAMDGQPHTQTPDVDNLAKALLDAVYGDDAHLWLLTIAKVWNSRPGIVIERQGAKLPYTLVGGNGVTAG